MLLLLLYIVLGCRKPFKSELIWWGKSFERLESLDNWWKRGLGTEEFVQSN